MNAQQLAEIEARANAATPGPWRMGRPRFACHIDHGERSIAGHSLHPGGAACDYRFDGWDDGPEISHDRQYRPDDRQAAADDSLIAGTWDYGDGGIVGEDDAVFIVSTRQDVPALVAEVRRLRQHMIEIERMAVRHEESAEWEASAAIPAILGRSRRALRGDDT